MSYKAGDKVPLPNGLVFGLEGAVLVIDGLLADVIPYDCMWDKWGGWIGAEAKKLIESNNPVKVALDAIDMPIPETFTVTGIPDEPEPECDYGCDDECVSSNCEVHAGELYQPEPHYHMGDAYRVLMAAEARNLMDRIKEIAAEVEAEMWEEAKMKEKAYEPYWMVHRRGKQSGSAKAIHQSFDSAFDEAERLAKKEMDTFVVLRSVCVIRPVDVVVEYEAIQQQRGIGIIDDPIECSHPPSDFCGPECGPIPKAACPCGCEPGDEEEQGCNCCDPVTGYSWDAIKEEGAKSNPFFSPTCPCQHCANTLERVRITLR